MSKKAAARAAAVRRTTLVNGKTTWMVFSRSLDTTLHRPGAPMPTDGAFAVGSGPTRIEMMPLRTEPDELFVDQLHRLTMYILQVLVPKGEAMERALGQR